MDGHKLKRMKKNSPLVPKNLTFFEDQRERKRNFSCKKPSFGLLKYLPLKILFFDLFIQLGDLGFNATQGMYVYQNILVLIYFSHFSISNLIKY